MCRIEDIIITEITDVISVLSEKGSERKMVNRSGYGLSFCQKGKITYTYKGKCYVQDPEHAVLLPKGESYAIYGNKTGIFPVINFQCIHFHCDDIVVFPIKNINSIIKDFEQLKSLYLFQKDKAKMMSLLYNIIYKLCAGSQSEPQILSPAIKYLEEHLSSPELSNAELAMQCNISEVYFRKLFTKHYGMSPKQYIIDIRLNKAKQLLSEGSLKINAISELCGFASTYHFSRLFKEKTGLTPSEYAKQNRILKI